MTALLVICLVIAAATTLSLLTGKKLHVADLIVKLWPKLGQAAPMPANNTQTAPTEPQQADRDASEKLVDLIDILFALVLGLPVLIGTDVFTHPGSHGAPIILAFVTGTYVVVRSYVDWHISMEDAPYWIRTSTDSSWLLSAGRSWELRRVYVDFVIVLAYVLMFLFTDPLVKSPGADIGRLLFILVVIQLLYLVWGALRRRTYGGGHEYLFGSITKAALGLLALWGAYRVSRDHGLLFGGHGTARNDVAIIAALIITLAYRRANWREMRIPPTAKPSALPESAESAESA